MRKVIIVILLFTSSFLSADCIVISDEEYQRMRNNIIRDEKVEQLIKKYPTEDEQIADLIKRIETLEAQVKYLQEQLDGFMNIKIIRDSIIEK